MKKKSLRMTNIRGNPAIAKNVSLSLPLSVLYLLYISANIWVLHTSWALQTPVGILFFIIFCEKKLKEEEKTKTSMKNLAKKWFLRQNVCVEPKSVCVIGMTLIFGAISCRR